MTTLTIPARFEGKDPRFRGIDGDFVVEVLDQSARKSEGPVYLPLSRRLVWSDIPNSRLLSWDEATGAVGVFRQDSGYANGNTLDPWGRLVTCEQGNRRVTRTEHDGSVTVLADSYAGRRLNSPNDVVVRSDGSIWFTDPSYGIDTDYEGHAAESELEGCFVFRVDPRDGRIEVVADDFARPNGLAFSPDESILYVVDTRQEPSHVRAFEVDGERLRGGRVVAECAVGRFDGLRLDAAGRLWVAAWDGVEIFDPDGTQLGTLVLPEPAANLTFGGPYRNHLFVCAGRSLYALRVTVTGARPHWQEPSATPRDEVSVSE